MKTFLKVLGFVLVLGLGFGIGYRYYKYRTVLIAPATVQSTDNSSTPKTQIGNSGKFFELFSTYTEARDMSNPRIEFAYLDQGLLLFSYPTSQETESYGVYDYKNDVIYKNIGNASGSDESYTVPTSFIDTDTLLRLRLQDQKGIVDLFNYKTNTVLKTAPISIPMGYVINDASHFAKDNTVYITLRNSENTTVQSTYIHYRIDTKTLSVTTQ